MTGIALDIDETLCATAVHWAKELSEKFGNPENLAPEKIMARYRYTQKVPFWQSPEALAWMAEATASNEQYLKVPPFADVPALVRELHAHAPIAAYLTARPECTRTGTLAWLTTHGFPEAELIMRPDELLLEKASRWKAEALVALYPRVWGIIDDNPHLLDHLPADYPGTIFLYDHPPIETPIKTFTLSSWSEVLPAVQAALRSV